MWITTLPAGILLLILLSSFFLYRSIYHRSSHAHETAAILTVFLTMALVVEGSWQYVQWRGTQVIQEISGKSDSYMTCQRLSDEFLPNRPIAGAHGWVLYDSPNVATVRYQVCQEFRTFLWSGGESLWEVESLGLIIHEGFHVDGDFNESSTECKTINIYAEVAHEMFGIEPEQAERMARFYARNNAYRPPEYKCSNHIYATQ